MQPHVDILIFGGAFDPPHVGHTTVVSEVLEAGYADTVAIMPVGQHPFDKNLSSAIHRLEMLQKAFAPVIHSFKGRVDIDTFELNQNKVSYTYHTVREYKKKFPDKVLGLLIGSDNVASFDSWQYSSELKADTHIFVYPRAGYDLDQSEMKDMILLADVSVVCSASSYIRKEIVAQGSSDLVDQTVLEYILENNLVQYWNDNPASSKK